MRNAKRSVLGLVFLTVFLDIVGFSIIFPLFPAMLEHYLALEGPESWLGRMASNLRELAGSDEHAVVTLFGGILGSLYAVLQFVFTPIWGGLSDRIGRRPTLLFTLVGTILGYVLWIFAGSFGLLIAARLLGGAMAGNISTASAVVADTTEGRDRAAGMGIVGMAIGLGFILGPALGGVFSTWELGAGEWTSGFALNPFSLPALVSALLACGNLLWVFKRLKETLPPERRGTSDTVRIWNPFAQLGRLSFPGLARTNFIYLIYLIAFSAMEFTLTFLAVERFQFTPGKNAAMFVFVGFVIALVQGGVVRRLAPKLGEKKVALVGMACLVPGFVVVAYTPNVPLFYGGLFLLAVGSALAMPCLSALASRYSPEDRQGLALGTLRAMGSLARALGPILGGVLYWQLGNRAPYLGGALLLLVPLALAAGLPPIPTREESSEPDPA